VHHSFVRSYPSSDHRRYLNFSAWLTKNVNIIWIGKDEIMTRKAFCGKCKSDYVTCLKNAVNSFLAQIYLLTPWSRALLEKLTGSQLVKKFLIFYGTRRFITVFTTAHHLSLSWASSIHSMLSHPTSRRSILIYKMSFYRCVSKWFCYWQHCYLKGWNMAILQSLM